MYPVIESAGPAIPNQLMAVDLSSGTTAVVIAITLIVSMVFYLKTNLSPCGLITPSYLVLALVQSPWSLITILGGTTVLWGIMTLLTKIMILYGKRLFAVTIGFGAIVQVSVFLALHRRLPYMFPGDSLSFVAPGLIVYQLVRQKKPLQTIAITGAVSAVAASLVFGALALPV
jgi:hypothetical protein